jgi:flagellar hook-length control protein FliK
LAGATASALKAGAQGLAAQAQAAQLQAAQASLAEAGAASALAAADAGGAEGTGPSFQGLLQAAAPPAAAPTPPPALQVPVPLASGRFAEDIGARVGWLAGQQIGHAEIRVNPDGLGPIEVRLRLDGDRVSADFLSPHAEVRQALEQGLPRLREMLAGQGFTLANADVGQQAAEQQRPGAPAFRFDGEAGDAGEGELAPIPVRMARGLVDAWA